MLQSFKKWLLGDEDVTPAPYRAGFWVGTVSHFCKTIACDFADGIVSSYLLAEEEQMLFSADPKGAYQLSGELINEDDETYVHFDIKKSELLEKDNLYSIMSESLHALKDETDTFIITHPLELDTCFLCTCKENFSLKLLDFDHEKSNENDTVEHYIKKL